MIRLILLLLITPCYLLTRISSDKQRVFQSDTDSPLSLLAKAAKQYEPFVFLVSLDGLRYDYIKNADKFNLSIPNIRRLIREGVLADGMTSVYPALTFPAHTTIITGVNPDRHGVYQNNEFEPSSESSGLYLFADRVKVPTLFDAARDRNILTSAVSWPLTCFSESIDYSLPDAPYQTRIEFDFYRRACLKSDLFKASYRHLNFPQYITDSDRLNLTLSLLEFGRINNIPRLNALHFVDFDHAQHVHGVFSKEAFAALEFADSLLGKLLDKIERRGILSKSSVFLVSDHGFTNLTTQISPGVLLASYGLIQGPDWKASHYVSPGIYAIYINPSLAQEERVETEAKIDSIASFLASQSQFGIKRALIGYESIRSANVRGYPGAYAILEAKESFWFTTATTGLLVKNEVIEGYEGSHGYSPEDEFMTTSFVAYGSRIKRGEMIGRVRLLDIAPTIAQILKLKLDGIEGRVINELFFKLID